MGLSTTLSKMVREHKMWLAIRCFPIGSTRRSFLSLSWKYSHSIDCFKIHEHIILFAIGLQVKHGVRKLQKTVHEEDGCQESWSIRNITINKAKKDIESHLFFSWFDEFTRRRASKTNVREIVSEGSIIGEEDLIKSDLDADKENHEKNNIPSKPQT